jgi:triphosphatase
MASAAELAERSRRSTPTDRSPRPAARCSRATCCGCSIASRRRVGDTLALKQMRVATRRMRSTWRLFDGAYRRSEQKRYLAELRRRRPAGRGARPRRAPRGLPAHPALAPLGEAWRAERAAAMAQLLGHLDSAAYRRFVADYRGFVGSVGHATARRLASARLDDVAGERLLAAYATLRESDPDRFDDDAALHVLRINGKRLRYALETFRELAPPAPWERLHARLIALQDLLGKIHDGVVAAELAERWLAETGSGADDVARAAVADYAARLRDEPLRGRAEVGRAWRAVSGRGFENDLRRVVAALSGPPDGELTDS